ncbi:MAG TPA: hypothetical protein VIK82_00115 [Porticoccaceae bacterium]
MTQTQGLDPTIKAGIESDLRMYRRWLARLEALEQEWANAMAQSGGGIVELTRTKGRHADPVSRWVAEADRIQREQSWLMVRIRRVEAALQVMTPEQRTLVERYYFDGAPRAVVERELGVSTRQFWRLRDEAFETYAYVAGLVRRTA